MRFSITLLLCLLLASAATAGPDLAPAGVCIFGNDPALTWTAQTRISGSESVAVPFLAEQSGCGCGAGYQMEAVSMRMYFEPTDVPVTVDVTVSLLEMDPGQGGACSTVGAELYASPYASFDVTTPGEHEFTVPLDLEESPCATFGYEYAVAMNVLTRFDNPIGLSTVQTFPEWCRGYMQHGGTWWDLAQFAVSPPALHADIVCCSPVVPAEEKSWGTLKSLYR